MGTKVVCVPFLYISNEWMKLINFGVKKAKAFVDLFVGDLIFSVFLAEIPL